MSLAEELRDHVQAYRSAWQSLDFAALKALWDEDEKQPIYKAEEQPEPLYDWPAIEAYWADTRQLLAAIELRISDEHYGRLTQYLAWTTFRLDWRATYTAAARPGAAPVGGDLRVYALVRQRPAGWRFVHYIEAPLGALPFLRGVYEGAASRSS